MIKNFLEFENFKVNYNEAWVLGHWIIIKKCKEGWPSGLRRRS